VVTSSAGNGSGRRVTVIRERASVDVPRLAWSTRCLIIMTARVVSFSFAYQGSREYLAADARVNVKGPSRTDDDRDRAGLASPLLPPRPLFRRFPPLLFYQLPDRT
jgi:hypothetical protein